MKKINILFIANGYGNSPVISGGETRLLSIIKYLPPYFEKTLMTTAAGSQAAGHFLGHGKTGIITVAASLFFRHEISAAFRLWSYLISAVHGSIKVRETKADIVYSSSDFICDVYPAYTAARSKNTKWVPMLHHMYMPPHKRPGNFLKNAVMYIMQSFSFSLISKAAHTVLVLDTDAGRMIERDLRSRGFKGKFHRVYNGVEPLKKRRSSKDRDCAVYIGGLRPSKGLYDIVPVWKEVCNAIPSMKLYIIGKGGQNHMEYLREGIRINGLERNAAVLGYLKKNEMDSYLDRAAIFFLPSHEEGWGISVAEAINRRCIPVVYALPAFRVFAAHVRTVECFNLHRMAMEVIKARNLKFGTGSLTFIRKFEWPRLAAREAALLKSIT